MPRGPPQRRDRSRRSCKRATRCGNDSIQLESINRPAIGDAQADRQVPSMESQSGTAREATTPSSRARSRVNPSAGAAGSRLCVHSIWSPPAATVAAIAFIRLPPRVARSPWRPRSRPRVPPSRAQAAVWRRRRNARSSSRLDTDFGGIRRFCSPSASSTLGAAVELSAPVAQDQRSRRGRPRLPLRPPPHRLLAAGPSRAEHASGASGWPLPLPLVMQASRWREL